MEKIIKNNVFYSSDRNLKENIGYIKARAFNSVSKIEERSFNFKDDEDKRTIYGVIAQEVQEAGLDELVHQKEDGTLGVDYISYLILKVAKLTKDNSFLINTCFKLEDRVKELENKLNNNPSE